MENLDEAASGGRVTRSLRKRLTSVDSDASSRPGTPVASKLSSISESTVPSLPLRMTRRNSITTPVKSVASKAKVGGRATTPEVNSPARRSARKRSISVVDVEHAYSSPVVKESIKQPIFDTLAEEELCVKRVTRSNSKSPQPLQKLSPQLQIKLHRSVKLEPKLGDESEVEIINCESEDDDVPKKTKNKSRKLSIKEEVLEILDDDTSTETTKIATPKIKKDKIQNRSPGSVEKSKENKNRTEDIKLLNDSLKKSEAHTDVTTPEEEVTPVQGEGSVSKIYKKGFVITEVVKLNNLTPNTMEKLVIPGIIEPSDANDKSPERTKSVVFNDSGDDQSVRSVYPKTPGLTKSKSYIDIDSSRDKSYQSFKDAEAEINELPDSKKQNLSMELSAKDSNDYHRAEAEAYDVDPLMPTYTPYKSKLLSNEQSSTPISCVTPTADDNREASEDLENELSCSPDKFLRSGKNYGNSPTFSPKSSPRVLNKSVNEATNRPEEMENSLKETQQTSAELPNQMTVKSPKQLHRESPKETPVKSPEPTHIKPSKETPTKSPKATSAKSPKETSIKSSKQTPAKSPKETPVNSPKQNLAKSPKNKNSQSGDEMVSSTVATPVENSPTKVAEKEPIFAKSWSQGVSGKANGGTKIDAIIAVIDVDKTAENVIDEQKSPSQKTPPPRKRISRYESEDEEIVGDDEHIDEEDEEELAADEVAHTKHAFVDDEAMEVDDDYASGDSMDEKERREIEEHAIEEDGESIGSEDTEEADHHHEDDDEENASFIVSDSERDDDLLEYSDDNEHLEETKNDKKKNYRRIQVISSESETEVEIIEEKANTKQDNTPNEEDTESISHDLALEVSKFIDDEISVSELVSETQTSPIRSPNKRKSTSALNASKSSAKLDESNSLRKSLNMSKSKFVSSEVHNISSKHDSLLNDAESNTSKLSESAMKLQYESESETTEDEHTAQQMNESRKEILNLNKSDRFNKTVHELDTEQQETTPEMMEEKIAPKRVSIAANKSLSGIESKRKSLNRSNLERSMREAIATSSSEEENEDEQMSKKPLRKTPLSQSLQMQRDQAYESSSGGDDEEAAEKDAKASGEQSSSDESEMKLLPRKSLNNSQKLNTSKKRHLALAADSSDDEISPLKPSVSLLGEVSAGNSTDSDESEEKEEEPAAKPTLKKKSSAGLSVSFDQIKKKNNKEMVSGKIRHSFFTLDVNVNKYANATAPEPQSSSSGEQNESEKDVTSNESSTLSSSPPNKTINSEEEQELKKLAEIEKLTDQHVYGSHRQSLALPVSYAMETSTAKKPKRKSCNALSTEEAQHSQSFVDRINERKRELELQNTKRKRLSKSFCGVAGSLDTTDHEVRHLHKKSKVSKSDDSESDSEEAATVAIVSKSPPRIKVANDDNNNLQRILGRCDEILEAANRAKLEAKINYKKSHVTLPKKRKQSKKKFKSESSENEENAIPLVSKKEMKRKEKTKLALKQALKASVGIILNVPGKKKLKPLLKIDEESLESKRLPAQVLEAISVKEDIAPKKKNKVPSETVAPLIPENVPQPKKFKTNAGAVVMAPLTPKKQKKSHITKFQHATGTVCVEPASPVRKPNLNGFRESPLRPHTTGFKVRQILTAGQDKVPTLPVSSSSLRRDGKRKRIVEPTHTLPKPQWSQSGLFLEEELTPRAVLRSGTTEYLLSGLQGGSRKSKKIMATAGASTFASSALNFKHSTMFRDDIPREDSHKLLQRKERRYVHNQF